MYIPILIYPKFYDYMNNNKSSKYSHGKDMETSGFLIIYSVNLLTNFIESMTYTVAGSCILRSRFEKSNHLSSQVSLKINLIRNFFKKIIQSKVFDLERMVRINQN